MKVTSSYKNLEKPTFIDIIMTNELQIFHYSCAYEVDLPGFLKMI